MKSRILCGRVSWTVAESLLLMALLTSVAGAQAAFNFSPGGFSANNVCASSAPGSCQVLTNTSAPDANNQPTGILPSVTSGGALRLNSALQNQHASAWYYAPVPLNTGFTTAFQFTLSGCNGCGDGMALVIQGDPSGPAAIGYTANGSNLSYGNNDISAATGPNNAILNSLAVELDTYQNTEFADPDSNHIAVQSCGPVNGSGLSPNSADHAYICANGTPANLALQSLSTVPGLSGVSLADGSTHTITVNYLAPGTCTQGCNNFSIYLDSVLVLQTTLDITKQLVLDQSNSAYIGFTSATGAAVENADIVSWSYSQLPLAPITITQPLQPTSTDFNFTSTLSASIDYSQSGSTTSGVFMQGTVQAITDQQFSDLVANTPFQGSTCLHQDLGNNTYACVTTTVLCTTSSNTTPAGSNCPDSGNSPLIGANNVFHGEPAQKPITAPGYLMGKDTALSCAITDAACKGLINIFTGIVGDPTVSGKTKNFNSVLIPVQGVPTPLTLVTPSPMLTNSWTNQPVTLTFSSSVVAPPPSINSNPYSPLPAVASINYSATGANPLAAAAITGPTGSVVIPNTNEGTTVVTFSGTDAVGTVETVVTNSTDSTGTKVVSTAPPTFTIKTDKTPPSVSCVAPAAVWQMTDVAVPCTASDNPTGSGLANSSQASFSLTTAVPAGTETSSASIAAVTVLDVAGNSAAQGPFGPFLVDKKAPTISGLTISPAAPTVGQAVTASYSCADGGSGVVLCGPSGASTIAATANTGTLTSAADGTVGTHTFTVSARDLAGNLSAPVSVNYTVANSPQLSITPSSIAFGTVKKFSLTLKTITVQNTGTLPVVFQSVKLTQTESDGGVGRQFLMLNGCRSQLAAGASCNVKILFAASEVVSATGLVTFVDNAQGSAQTVSITGNVVKGKS